MAGFASDSPFHKVKKINAFVILRDFQFHRITTPLWYGWDTIGIRLGYENRGESDAFHAVRKQLISPLDQLAVAALQRVHSDHKVEIVPSFRFPAGD